MIIKIDGKIIGETAEQSLPVLTSEAKRELFPKAVAVSAFIGSLNMAGSALAATKTLSDRMIPLIGMIQDLGLPASIVVSSWGLVEIIIGNVHSGKEKLKYAVIGFIGMYLVPEIFYAIRDSFQVNIAGR